MIEINMPNETARTGVFWARNLEISVCQPNEYVRVGLCRVPYKPGSLRSMAFRMASLIERTSFQRAGLGLLGRSRLGLGSRVAIGESNS